MAAQSDAVVSMKEPESTMYMNGNVVVILCKIAHEINAKLFQASSVEIYKGLGHQVDENTLEFYPKNPYGFAKLAAHWCVRFYREQYKCYMNNGIIANAESPRRNAKFVTRKIAEGVKRIVSDPSYVLKIGNLDSRRDWIHAYDVAMAAWLTLQQEQPGDYMIGLGETHTVRDFIEMAFSQVGINIKWEGKNIHEMGVDSKSGRVLVKVDPTFFREYEDKCSYGNNTKLKSIGWIPKYTLSDIISEL